VQSRHPQGAYYLCLLKLLLLKYPIVVHQCVIKSVVMWLHVLVGPYWCVYVALFGSVTLANMNIALPEDGVTPPKRVRAILT
jgi:hypothetical protein